MRLRRLVYVLLLLTAIPACSRTTGASKRPSTPPNVVLISVDTLRADHLGCYGYARNTSPNLDRLAAEGVRFENAFSASSWTLPSHMSIMTSQYPHVHGVQTGNEVLPDSATTLAEAMSAGGYYTAGFASWVYVDKRWGFGQGFDEYFELVPPQHLVDSTTQHAFKAEQVADQVVGWLEQPRQGDKPLFLFVHMFDPHIDYDPPAAFKNVFDPDYQGPANGSFGWLKQYIKGLHRTPPDINPRDLEHVEALYDAEILYTDTHVGRILNAVRAKLGENTLIIFTSDHGEEFFDHGSMEGHQWTLYEEVIRVPLIVKPPFDAEDRKVIPNLVGLIDIAPTILDFAGMSAPGVFMGQSFLPLIEGDDEGDDSGRLIYSETQRHTTRQSIRGHRYKLIHTDDTKLNRRGVPIKGGYELYDLQTDPKEKNNLYRDDLSIARFLVSELEAHRTGGAGPTSAPSESVEFSEEELRRLRAVGYSQ